jgi:hypothetical protein
MKSKIFTVEHDEAAEAGKALDKAINAFLKRNDGITVTNTQCQVLDVGGPSQARVLIVYTMIYSV